MNPIEVGQCTVCGGRGGYPGVMSNVVCCERCLGTGVDPAAGEDWFLDVVAPEQTNPHQGPTQESK